ncbi:MAG: trypsin-like peptidase domain-containing protein [Pyrinomonadaceae bacterium]|nr:trypsin-like peptidase domain-containing protein [Pyrinomonadaceae bacterium]
MILSFAATIVSAQEDVGRRVAPAIATILARSSGAQRFEVVGSGVFVRDDGVLLTAYDLVKGGREIQVRMANGEVYDKVEVLASDERRNLAVLRINAIETPFVVIGAINDSVIGMRVTTVYNAGGQGAYATGGMVSSISLADEIPGAGTGFRVLKFTAPVTAEAAGGVIVDNYGRALGLIAPLRQAQTQSYALPLHHIIGVVRSVPNVHSSLSSPIALAPKIQEMNRAYPVYQSSTTPLEPMPQVAVPQRATTALTPAGPGSVVVKETDPGKLLVASKTLYIVSYSNVFKSVQLLNELRKRKEFTDWNLSFVDEREVADLILDIEHVALTWEFPFSIRHQRTGIVITAGKIYAWGGGDGAPLMASRVVERLTKLRASVKPETTTENKTTPKQ